MILAPGEWNECGEGLVSGETWRFPLLADGACVVLVKFPRPSRDGYGWGVDIALPGALLGYPHDQWAESFGVCTLPAKLSLVDAQITARKKAAAKLREIQSLFNQWACVAAGDE